LLHLLYSLSAEQPGRWVAIVGASEWEAKAKEISLSLNRHVRRIEPETGWAGIRPSRASLATVRELRLRYFATSAADTNGSCVMIAGAIAPLVLTTGTATDLLKRLHAALIMAAFQSKRNARIFFFPFLPNNNQSISLSEYPTTPDDCCELKFLSCYCISRVRQNY
jgi:hypothetical protein